MLLSFVLIFVISYFFYQKYKPNLFYFLIAISLKLLAGLCVGLLYFYHYKDGDTLNYIHDLRIIQELSFWEYFNYLLGDYFPKNVIYNEEHLRAVIFLRIISILNFLAQGNYWAMALLLSAFNFFACWYLYERFISIFPHLKQLTYLVLFINPSFVFWSSGLMKESLIVGIIFICQAIFLAFIYGKIASYKWLYIVSLICSFVIVWKIKYYFMAAFLGFFMPYLIVKLLVKKSKYQLSIYVLIVCFSLLGASFLHPNLHIQNVLKAIVLNHDLTIKSSPANAYIVFNDLLATPISFLQNMPKALFSGLFSPLYFNISIRLGESLLNLFILGVLIFNLKKYWKEKWILEVWVAIFFIAFLAIFLAFSSPNYGSLVRYKTIFSPLFLLLVFYPQRNFFKIKKENIRH